MIELGLLSFFHAVKCDFIRVLLICSENTTLKKGKLNNRRELKDLKTTHKARQGHQAVRPLPKITEKNVYMNIKRYGPRVNLNCKIHTKLNQIFHTN